MIKYVKIYSVSCDCYHHDGEAEFENNTKVTDDIA